MSLTHEINRRIKQRRDIQAAERKQAVDIRFDAPIEITASEAADGTETVPSFSMVAYSGAPMRPGGWNQEHPLVLDMRGMKLSNKSIPVHRDHDTSKVLGHSTEIKADGGRLTIKGQLSAVNDHAREVTASSKNNFPWQASVGANLIGQPRFVAEGESANVNGKRVPGPVFVQTMWTLKEASFVSLGADANTSAVAARRSKPMNDFEKWIAAQGIELATLEDAAVSELHAAFDAFVLAKKQPRDDEDEDRDEEELEPEMAAKDDVHVKAAVEHYHRMELVEEHLAGNPKLQAQAIAEKWDDSKIQLEGLRASYAKASAIHIRGDVSTNAQAVEAALWMAHGGAEDAAVKSYGEKTVEAARRLPKTAGLQWLIHQVIRAGGQYATPGAMDSETIRIAGQAERQIQAAGGFSTLSLSGVLSNLAGKALLRAYQEAAGVASIICRETDQSDFKQHTKYRVTTPGLLDKLGATGEIKHTTYSEQTYANQVETYARMIALTRQMIINDDLGAFLQIPASFGAMAARTRERAVFTVLMDNTDGFFNATATVAAQGYLPNALASGGSSALGTASLASAEALFWGQVDEHGNPLSLVPNILLVSHSKYRLALNIINQTTVMVVGDPTSEEQLRVSNEFLGAFRVAQSPYVQNAGITGYSATQWWLFSAPSTDVAALEIAYLRGRRVPTIESADTDFNTLGMQWRAYFDFGVAKQDPRAGVYSPGA